MLLNKDISLGHVVGIGDRHIQLEVEGNLLTIDLSAAEADELHNYVQEQENLLVPVNIKTRQLVMETGDHWNELNMEELDGATDPIEEM